MSLAVTDVTEVWEPLFLSIFSKCICKRKRVDSSHTCTYHYFQLSSGDALSISQTNKKPKPNKNNPDKHPYHPPPPPCTITSIALMMGAGRYAMHLPTVDGQNHLSLGPPPSNKGGWEGSGMQLALAPLVRSGPSILEAGSGSLSDTSVLAEGGLGQCCKLKQIKPSFPDKHLGIIQSSKTT